VRKGALLAGVLAALGAILAAGTCLRAGDAAKPKYGPSATPLERAPEYLREAPAPDFWALIPYYAAQQSQSSCSLASAVAVVNAARDATKLGSEEELATEAALLERAGVASWKRAVGALGHGVTLDELGPDLAAALRGYGVTVTSVEAIHVDGSPGSRERVHAALVENERAASDFIVANFLQGVYTGDAMAGHVAPVGAYDAARRRVLILDPDRRWYGPYWVPEDVFVDGMATMDAASGATRGLVWVKLAPR
jgi:hypothetical protein